MEAGAGMRRGNRTVVGICTAIILFSLLFLVTSDLHSIWGQQAPPFAFVAGIAGWVSIIFLYLVCFDDMRERQFRDPNTKMNWTAGVLLIWPLLAVYLIYFGAWRVWRERQQNSQTG